MPNEAIIIKDTHRGLLYQDGQLVQVLSAGRYELPPEGRSLFGQRRPKVEIVLVDMRERDLTLKGQEILTSDKVAIRVNILTQFRVIDPRAALHEVESYEDRLYSDVRLAARRSLAAMTLEQILTNRNQLSEDILRDVKEAANKYGVDIIRADVKDIIFPGNLQEIMNRVLQAERLAEAQLVDARTQAERQRIDALAKAEIRRLEAEALAETQRINAENDARIQQIKTEADVQAVQQRSTAAALYTRFPPLLRLVELETLRDLSRSAAARIYVNFNRDEDANGDAEG